jgi:hypothetical protein
MPKIANEVANAVRKATKLIPCCPCPAPRLDEFVEELEAVDVVVEDILRSLWPSEIIETWKGFNLGLQGGG